MLAGNSLLVADNDGQGFVPAGRLAVGNAIVTRAGPGLVVQSVTWQRHPEGIAVYNLVVDEDHTYFVGKANGGAWVHNDPCPGLNKQFGKKFGEHWDSILPGYRTHQEYRGLADSLYNDPSAIRITYPPTHSVYPGETHIMRGNDLLRLDPGGNFRSLYPGAYPPGTHGY